MEKGEDMIAVGRVINTQGHRGEVRVWPLTDFPERFSQGKTVILQKEGTARRLTVEKMRSQKNFLVIKFVEIPDMNAAEDIKEGYLMIGRDELTKLPEDTFYIFEILDMQVVLADGTVLGKVKDVVQAGGNDIYVVAGRIKDYQIPAVKEIVKLIDRENRRIIINPPEGLLDL
ncbi:MAG: 16S rRNA processing protein RimM [Firmicutes bacterium HGW-Firmicutes-14]|nr:MAG: 16S rRNA processing protein RimM [Firmicutes bacterium HGW-Firmicutes-14]